MYLSLRWYSLSKSYDSYASFSSNFNSYKTFKKVVGKNLHSNTFLFYYITSESNNEDIMRSIASADIDEIFLIYNMYNAFIFIRNENVILYTYPLFYLNTPNKYKAKDIIKIDLIAQVDGVRKIKNFHFGENFVGYFYHKFLSSLNHAFVNKSEHMGALIENLRITNDLSSFKSESYAYLEYLGEKISNILKILKSYLYIFDFKDMLDIVKESDPNSYSFDFYLNIYLFYSTSSIIIDIDLYLKYTGKTKNQNFKIFLTLDKSFYAYKDIEGNIKTEFIENKDLEDNKKDIFKSVHFVKRRYNKINLI
ncbi:MAG: hypothetical protein QXF12_00665 [Candidatus Aenigmatarchaeota archaeon]